MRYGHLKTLEKIMSLKRSNCNQMQAILMQAHISMHVAIIRMCYESYDRIIYLTQNGERKDFGTSSATKM